MFNFVLILFVLFLLFALSMIWPPDSPWAPWWRTSKKIARQMARLAKVTKKDTVYDLGSGEGTALMVSAEEFGARGVGIEIDPLRFYYSKYLVRKNGLKKEIEIRRENFFDTDISEASVIFVYLVPKALDRLIPKFKKELKKGTRIVSFRYEVDLPLKKFDKKNNLRLYVI